MTSPHLRSLTAAALATVSAVSASAALAQKNDDDLIHSTAERNEACQLAGCNNGRLECGTIEAQILRITPFGFGEFIPWIESQSWSCYETGARQ